MSAQLKEAIMPSGDVGMGAPARVDRRIVDGKEVIVLLVRAQPSARETAALLQDVRARFANLEAHIHHIELETTPHVYAQIRKAMEKRQRRAVR